MIQFLMLDQSTENRFALWERLVNRAKSLQMDFSGKVRWSMANDKGLLIPLLQDKYRVKEVVRGKGVAAAKVLYITDDPTTIPFHLLPSDCFIKANHGSGWNLLRKDGQFFRFGNGNQLLDIEGNSLSEELLTPYRMSMKECISQCQVWLATKYSVNEPSYHRIPPCIFVEEILHPADSGRDMKDYRFYTFNGRVRAINVGSPMYRRRGENVFFTPQWKEIPLTIYKEKQPEPLPSRPSRLEEMIACAEQLGRGINFVRVDLYDTINGVFFGELTFYPEGGFPQTPTACPRFNRWLSSFWRLKAR